MRFALGKPETSLRREKVQGVRWTLLWCHHCTGTPPHRRRADIEDGVALQEARRREERTYTELCQGNGRARSWSLREKSGAGLKRPRRSCGRWFAPRRRQCHDRCTAVPEPLGIGGGWLTPGRVACMNTHAFARHTSAPPPTTTHTTTPPHTTHTTRHHSRHMLMCVTVRTLCLLVRCRLDRCTPSHP